MKTIFLLMLITDLGPTLKHPYEKVGVAYSSMAFCEEARAYYARDLPTYMTYECREIEIRR